MNGEKGLIKSKLEGWKLYQVRWILNLESRILL